MNTFVFKTLRAVVITLMVLVCTHVTINAAYAKEYSLNNGEVIVNVPDEIFAVATREHIPKNHPFTLKDMENEAVYLVAHMDKNNKYTISISILDSNEGDFRDVAVGLSYLFHNKWDDFQKIVTDEAGKKRFIKNMIKSSNDAISNVRDFHTYESRHGRYFALRYNLTDGNFPAMAYMTARGEKMYRFMCVSNVEIDKTMESHLEQIVASAKYTLPFNDDEETFNRMAEKGKKERESSERTHFWLSLIIGGILTYGISYGSCSLIKKLATEKFDECKTEEFQNKFNVKKLTDKFTALGIFIISRFDDSVILIPLYLLFVVIANFLYALYIYDNIKNSRKRGE